MTDRIKVELTLTELSALQSGEQTMMIYGDCKICGATPINDASDLCEACEEQARLDGEFDGDEDEEAAV
jgi:hypothetical protein